MSPLATSPAGLIETTFRALVDDAKPRLVAPVDNLAAASDSLGLVPASSTLYSTPELVESLHRDIRTTFTTAEGRVVEHPAGEHRRKVTVRVGSSGASTRSGQAWADGETN